MPTFLASEAGKGWRKPYVVRSVADGKWYVVSMSVRREKVPQYGREYPSFGTEAEAISFNKGVKQT